MDPTQTPPAAPAETAPLPTPPTPIATPVTVSPPAQEPLSVVKDGERGNPEFAEDQYQRWLDDMAPFLKLGQTLNSAIDDAGLTKHKVTIYKKAKLKDWFNEKIEGYQSTPGKIANNILTKRLFEIDDKIKQGRAVDKDDMADVKFMAEKHRSAQPYFVTRTETAEAKEDDLGKILDRLETNYDKLGSEASKQMVETNTPVQNKG